MEITGGMFMLNDQERSCRPSVGHIWNTSGGPTLFCQLVQRRTTFRDQSRPEGISGAAPLCSKVEMANPMFDCPSWEITTLVAVDPSAKSLACCGDGKSELIPQLVQRSYHIAIELWRSNSFAEHKIEQLKLRPAIRATSPETHRVPGQAHSRNRPNSPPVKSPPKTGPTPSHKPALENQAVKFALAASQIPSKTGPTPVKSPCKPTLDSSRSQSVYPPRRP